MLLSVVQIRQVAAKTKIERVSLFITFFPNKTGFPHNTNTYYFQTVGAKSGSAGELGGFFLKTKLFAVKNPKN